MAGNTGYLYNDITGQRFHKLTAVRRTTKQSKPGNYYWLFKCDCGGIIETLPSNVRRSKSGTVSCGCVQKARQHGKAWLTSMIWDYIKHAEKLGVEYNLSRDEFENLTNQKCSYCSDSPRNGIDRADPLKGYTMDNCVSCCKVCNYMKRTMTVEQFLTHIKKIAAAV